MGGRQVQLLDQRGQVLDVLAHLIRGVHLGARRVVVPAGVGDHPVAGGQSLQLSLPRPPVAEAAMDEDHGVTGTALRVVEAPIVFGLRLHAVYPSLVVSFPTAGATDSSPR